MPQKKQDKEYYQRKVNSLDSLIEIINKGYLSKKLKEAEYASKHKKAEDLLTKVVKTCSTDTSMTRGMLDCLESSPSKAQQYVNYVTKANKKLSETREAAKKLQRMVNKYYKSYNKFYLKSKYMLDKLEYYKKERVKANSKLSLAILNDSANNLASLELKNTNSAENGV